MCIHKFHEPYQSASLQKDLRACDLVFEDMQFLLLSFVFYCMIEILRSYL